MEIIERQVVDLLDQEPTLLPAEMATRLNVSEYDVVSSLPTAMVATLDGAAAQSIFERLVGFGPVMTIMHSFGSIFEVKAPFPKGKVAHGYYNLMGKEGELNGHLNLDRIKNIALVSKPFRGRESHYIGFFCESGNNIFKVYLGRDKKRNLIPDQVKLFKDWQHKIQTKQFEMTV
jgi:putative heme utilization carrier protein HutX